jgi:Mor family transcriptional regulator
MASPEFERDLMEAIVDPLSRAKVVAVLERWRGVSIYLRSRKKNARREQAARNMIVNGMESPDIADALRQRYGICDRQARRDVRRARGQDS